MVETVCALAVVKHLVYQQTTFLSRMLHFLKVAGLFVLFRGGSQSLETNSVSSFQQHPSHHVAAQRGQRRLLKIGI